MSAPQHIDDLAELYALGMLSDAERDALDGHIAACEPCAKRVGDAEAVVASLVIEAEPPRSLDARVRRAVASRPAVARLGPLIAAAFILGLLPSLWLLHAVQVRSAFDDDRRAAIVAMLHSHFTHAQFVSIAPDAPRAKVIFARGGAWCYVVAQTRKAYRVQAQTAGRATDLGTLRVSGDTAELFVPHTDAGALVLLDGTRAVARAAVPRASSR